MSRIEIIELCRVIVVIVLVVVAAVVATPPNKVPLALRGLVRILKRDGTLAPPRHEVTPRASASEHAVPTWKKLLSFALCILAFIIAKI